MCECLRYSTEYGDRLDLCEPCTDMWDEFEKAGYPLPSEEGIASLGNPVGTVSVGDDKNACYRTNVHLSWGWGDERGQFARQIHRVPIGTPPGYYAIVLADDLAALLALAGRGAPQHGMSSDPWGDALEHLRETARTPQKDGQNE